RIQSDNIDGIPCIHRSWNHVVNLVRKAGEVCGRDRVQLNLLQELFQHLRGYEWMPRIRDNMVYVVALANGPMNGVGANWIDVVENDGRYFHPVGRGYPYVPPNYIGFRYNGFLQSVHHVSDWLLVHNVAEINPNWQSTDVDHFVYTLGPAIRPAQPLPSGPIWNRRVNCAIDTLLSGEFLSVQAASEATTIRLAASGAVDDHD
ncbi:hypothetical protein, partial [Aerococcus loyolae]